MISFDDPRWDDLEGGYRIEYDPRPALLTLEDSPDDPDAWAELWEELHHQGDVGEASYAAVPYLAALAELGTLAVVDAREASNPPVKRAALGMFALTSGLRGWGRILGDYSDDEVLEALGLAETDE